MCRLESPSDILIKTILRPFFIIKDFGESSLLTGMGALRFFQELRGKNDDPPIESRKNDNPHWQQKKG